MAENNVSGTENNNNNNMVESHQQSPVTTNAINDEKGSVESASAHPYRLFNRQRTLHQVLGSGTVADVMLWRKRSVCIGVVVAATAAWYLFEHSGYTFLSLAATILLLLVGILFVWANAASLLHRPPPPLPELELSEEMVNNIAASMRVRVNNALAVAHDIAIGKDVKLFLKVVVMLWLFSIFGNWFNFLTLAYICLVLGMTIPALYNRYEEHVDRTVEKAHKEITRKYREFDVNVLSKVQKGYNKPKTQ